MDDKPHRAEPAWPIVGVKDHTAPSVFRPESLLREARRQRQLPLVAVPEICVLDPDGDVVRHLKRTGAGRIRRRQGHARRRRRCGAGVAKFRVMTCLRYARAWLHLNLTQSSVYANH